jgi:hypothetical protein
MQCTVLTDADCSASQPRTIPKSSNHGALSIYSHSWSRDAGGSTMSQAPLSWWKPYNAANGHDSLTTYLLLTVPLPINDVPCIELIETCWLTPCKSQSCVDYHLTCRTRASWTAIDRFGASNRVQRINLSFEC